VLVTAAVLCAGLPAPARADNSPDAALARLLDNARAAAAAPGRCAQPDIDRLARILCIGRIRVGVRYDYPLFSTRTGETRQGYEVDVARYCPESGSTGIARATRNGHHNYSRL
jgi:ABC-type amino acid transport substrate-binding protein